MIYEDHKRRIEGVWNKSTPWTAERHIQIYGESLADAMRWIDETPAKWRANQSDKGNPPSQEWDLKAGMEGARRMAVEGWQDGVNDLDTRLQAIMPATGREAGWGHHVAGSSVSIGRFLTGNPRDMRTRKRRESGSAPVLHIVVNGNASCMVRAEQMANYGCAIVGLIDRLENRGRRVMLDVLYVCNEHQARVACGWNVKQAGDHVDLADVAFSIAHPAAFRRLGFALIERCPKEFENYGYGYCADIQPIDLIDPVDGVMLLDGVNHEPGRCNSPDDALRLAVEQLNKAAVLAGHATPWQPLIEDAFEYA